MTIIFAILNIIESLCAVQRHTSDNICREAIAATSGRFVYSLKDMENIPNKILE